jgi:hypothetical protein
MRDAIFLLLLLGSCVNTCGLSGEINNLKRDMTEQFKLRCPLKEPK